MRNLYLVIILSLMIFSNATGIFAGDKLSKAAKTIAFSENTSVTFHQTPVEKRNNFSRNHALDTLLKMINTDFSMEGILVDNSMTTGTIQVFVKKIPSSFDAAIQEIITTLDIADEVHQALAKSPIGVCKLSVIRIEGSRSADIDTILNLFTMELPASRNKVYSLVQVSPVFTTTTYEQAKVLTYFNALDQRIQTLSQTFRISSDIGQEGVEPEALEAILNTSPVLTAAHTTPVASYQDVLPPINSISFYPSPGNGALHLRFRALENQHTDIRIRNLFGKEVYEETLYNFSGEYDGQLNLQGIPQGVYILQVVQGNYTISKKIIIRQD